MSRCGAAGSVGCFDAQPLRLDATATAKVILFTGFLRFGFGLNHRFSFYMYFGREDGRRAVMFCQLNSDLGLRFCFPNKVWVRLLPNRKSNLQSCARRRAGVLL